MAQMKDISDSVLATVGTEMKAGLLSILEKKGIKMLKSSEYKLNPLYWRLVSCSDQTYLLGYSHQLGGAKAIKKLLIKGCSIEMNLPGKVVVTQHSNEMYLCIQCDEKITFLKAESKRQRNKWVDAIRKAMKEPIYHPSMVSTTSTDSSESIDVPRGRDQRQPSSVHNTADTAPRPGADWKRVNTTPAGEFEMTKRPSVSSIPSSAHALAMQNRRSREMASAKVLQSQQSGIRSLNSADRMRSVSQRELNEPAIYAEDAKYSGLEGIDDYEHVEAPPSKRLFSSTSKSTSQPNLRVQDPDPSKQYTQKSRYRRSGTKTKSFQQAKSSCDVNESRYEEIDDDKEEYPLIPPPSPPDMPAKNVYMTPLEDNDDQSSVSCVNNLGLESGGNVNENIYEVEDTIAQFAPKLPKRDYLNPKSVVQEELVKKKSSKIRAPQSPKVPIDQMDSIEREKTVCLETQSQRDLQPMRKEANDDNEKELPGKTNRLAQNGESLLAYIQRFRSELFKEDGFIVEVDKIDLSPQSMKLVCVHDCICIAALPNAKLHSLLHVDDVIVKVNRQTLPSIDLCYTLFRTTDENKVQLSIKRVMHGIMCHVIMSANGDVHSLGLEFGNQGLGNEVTSMQSEGLVAKSGSPYRPRAPGVVKVGTLVNWGLVEINRVPVSFDSSPADVRNQIQRSGCELALVFIPMDLINVFKEGLCGESTDQQSAGEGTC